MQGFDEDSLADLTHQLQIQPRFGARSRALQSTQVGAQRREVDRVAVGSVHHEQAPVVAAPVVAGVEVAAGWTWNSRLGLGAAEPVGSPAHG